MGGGALVTNVGFGGTWFLTDSFEGYYEGLAKYRGLND